MKRIVFGILKAALALFALLLVLGIAATVALKIYLPPEKLKNLLVAEAAKSLKREIRLKSVSWSLMKGLTLRGLEISEVPGFKKGVFAGAESFNLNVRWAPLLHKKVVVDRVAVEGLELSVRKGKDGAFNFSDLGSSGGSSAPAAPAAAEAESSLQLAVRQTSVSGGRVVYKDAAGEWIVSDIRAKVKNFRAEKPFDADIRFKVQGRPLAASVSFSGRIDPGAPSADIRSLAVESRGLKADISGSVRGGRKIEVDLKAKLAGGSEVEVKGRIGPASGDSTALDLMIKCRSFVLDELASLSDQTKGLGLSGGGQFAVGVAGTASKPVFSGKLQFKDLGATVEGLALAGFTGTASFDERAIDVPGLKGKVADGALALDLSVKDYSRAPDINFEASLTRFDLARFLAAKASMDKKSEAKAAARPGGESASRAPLKIKGKFSVGKLVYAGMSANDAKLSWDLAGLTPDMKGLSGWAKLNVAGGKLENLGDMAAQSKLAKIAVFPLMVIQKVGRLGGIQLFPDLNNVSYKSIVGDYAFAKGLMTLRQCKLEGDDVHVSSVGTINLPTEKLDLVVNAQVGGIAPLEVDVKGTFDNPSSKVRVDKLIAEPVKKLLGEPAQKLLEGIFNRR